MNRRFFMGQTCGFCATALIGGALPQRLHARTTIDLGETVIETVSDGHLNVPLDFLFDGVPKDDIAPILKRHGIAGTMLEPDCNLTLLRSGDDTVLFDIGAGPNFVPTTGKILDNLALLNVEPGEITHVVFTHAHPDHLWGVFDEFDDFTFPEAQYLIARTEWDYWTDPNTLSRLGDIRKPFAVGAMRTLKAIEERIRFFEDGDDLVAGVHAVATPGHTPGHSSFAVGKGENAVMIVGDAIANHHVAFERPNWPSGTDQEPGQGVQSRMALLDRIATDRMSMIGFHFPFPGIGRVERKGAAFRFIPQGQ